MSPAEIDAVLVEHPAVAAALTFPVKCDRLGESICAVVTLRDGRDLCEADLKAHAGEHLARFKVPHRILFRSEIPKGPTGKMQRIGMASRLGLD